MYLFSDMAMQMCNRRVTQVTTSFVRQIAKPVPMKVEDDHHDDDHTHIPVPKPATPKTLLSMSKYLLRGNVAITTGLSSMLFFNFLLRKMNIVFFSSFSCS